MCKSCYKAGVETYVFLAITLAIQLPLVWLSIRRTSPSSDSRTIKFVSLALAVFVIVGSAITYKTWKEECYDNLVKHIAGTKDRFHWGDGVTYNETKIHWNAYLIIIAAGLASVVAIINTSTPVPELYAHKWMDPRTIEMHANSGGANSRLQNVDPEGGVRESDNHLLKLDKN